MDTIAPKTPATLPFADWQSMASHTVAREIHARLAALPAPLRQAAVAWLRPSTELAGQLTVAPAGPLHGVPYALKDLFDLAGVPTRAGSAFLEKIKPLPDKDCRLVRQLGQLGATCVIKSHLVEFASGLTGENPHYGDCPHPFFPERLTGGSSSGSAALVAAGVVPFAIGTDTGGSVRVPAAWCGLHGFRLTPGNAYISDAFPLAPSMDTVGWFTAFAGDLLTTIQTLVGPSAISPRQPRGCYLQTRHLQPAVDPAVLAACRKSAARFASPADPDLETELWSDWREAVAAYITIGMSEAHEVHRNWLAPYREHYDPIIWQRFTDAGLFPAEQISQARRTMVNIQASWHRFFQDYDFLVMPAVPLAAPTKAEATIELRRNILTLTAPASLGGIPVLSLPVPLASGLTAGLQIIVPSADSPVIPWLLNQ